MLVLSRKTDEEIVIGSGPDEIRIMVIEIRGDKCKIGISAPKNVPVMRAELGEKRNASDK